MYLIPEKAELMRKELFNYIMDLELIPPTSDINDDIIHVASTSSKIELIATDTITATIQAHKNNPNSRIAILNFASYKNPGGGFMNNMYAQEEAICYCTNLFYELVNYSDWYKHPLNNGLYDNKSILSHNIAVVASERGNLLPPDEVFYIDVLTCAAPNLSSVLTYRPSLKEVAENISRDRVAYVMDIFANNHYDTIILGAFGCGVFKNDPNVIASAFKTYINNNSDKFKNIIFAIPDKTSKNYQTFKNILNRGDN